MIHASSRLVAVALLLAAATLPASAGSSASSASSEGASASVGSSSTSVEKSSNSSSKDDKVAAGDYRIVEMADASARPGQVRLHLQAAAGGDEFYLYVPRETVAQGGLAAGQRVTARTRDYGTEFARTDSKQAFFLVLEDAWHRELQTRAL
ncbi:conserved exported hypothetical protein [Rubrivivax sp. A210]|uniref:hypothetical protein n=1 Tax=Rubrivivax sp. A210 TaxID=2772301 RepID=UPI00191A34AB|nr:hypothetical protein [Rubrivivax sp. A210]CAD5372490.1 conserved exported hypothetical protein [Rubrivivax sp. A210]